MAIPGDELGRSWVVAYPNAGRGPESNALATLAMVNDAGELVILGNAFVIKSLGDKAICCAAAHSFDAAKHQQIARGGRDYFHMPPDFRPMGPEYINVNEVFVTFLVDGQVVQCSIEQLNYIANNDLAVFSVAVREGTPFRSHFAVDLAVPQVGDVVAVIANHITVEPGEEDGQFRVQQVFQMRQGTVTEVVWDMSILPGQSFYFQTTIPFTPGMSGAPIFKAPREGETLRVCGVVSSDFSLDEARTNMLVPGRSTASMLWPAMGSMSP